MRGREISSLQSKLAAAEAAAGAAAEKTRREADAEAERTRARLQAEITALSLQNRYTDAEAMISRRRQTSLPNIYRSVFDVQGSSGGTRLDRFGLFYELHKLGVGLIRF